MNSGYEKPAGPTIFVISGPNLSSNIINKYMIKFYTQRAFHKVQEHPTRSSDEDIMTVRSWWLPMNSGYEQPARPTIFVIYGHNLSSNIITIYLTEFETHIYFHRVQEHPKRSLDEEIMTVRSWRLPMNSGYEQPAGPTVFVIL